MNTNTVTTTEEFKPIYNKYRTVQNCMVEETVALDNAGKVVLHIILSVEDSLHNNKIYKYS